jgi:hypothetical protein
MATLEHKVTGQVMEINDVHEFLDKQDEPHMWLINGEDWAAPVEELATLINAAPAETDAKPE